MGEALCMEGGRHTQKPTLCFKILFYVGPASLIVLSAGGWFVWKEVVRFLKQSNPHTFLSRRPSSLANSWSSQNYLSSLCMPTYILNWLIPKLPPWQPEHKTHTPCPPPRKRLPSPHEDRKIQLWATTTLRTGSQTSLLDQVHRYLAGKNPTSFSLMGAVGAVTSTSSIQSGPPGSCLDDRIPGNTGVGQLCGATALPAKRALHGTWKTSSGQCDLFTVFWNLVHLKAT